jgi:hypothetical protein
MNSRRESLGIPDTQQRDEIRGVLARRGILVSVPYDRPDKIEHAKGVREKLLRPISTAS